MDNLSDIELVRRFKAGNKFAFELLYRRHYANVKKNCLKIIKNEQIADDLTQKTFLTALSKIGTLSHDNVIAWLCRIVKNLALNELKKQRLCSLDNEILDAYQQSSKSDDPAVESQKREISRLVIDAINELSEPTRTYVIDKDLRNMSYKDICEAYQITPNKLDWHLRKGRQILRDKLKGLE